MSSPAIVPVRSVRSVRTGCAGATAILIAIGAVLCGCGAGSGDTPNTTNTNNTGTTTTTIQGEVTFSTLASGGTVQWTGSTLSFSPEFVPDSPETAQVTIPYVIHTTSTTGTVVSQGSVIAASTTYPSSLLVAAPTNVDLTGIPTGTTIWVVLDPGFTLVAPAYQAADQASLRQQSTSVPLVAIAN